MLLNLIRRISRRRARTDILVESGVHLGGCLLFGPIRAGMRSYANDSMIRANTDIGRYCSIGRRCTIGAAKHALDRITTHPVAFDDSLGVVSTFDPKDRPRGVNIGHDVWVGDNVVVLDGVTIGSGSVIGAGAIVTRNVEPYSIVVGAPGRTIRKRFSSAQLGALLALRWWDYGDDILRGIDLNDVDSAISAMEHRSIRQTKVLPHHKWLVR